MVKLWLDDLRPAPEGWTWARTVEEAKEVLRTGLVFEISLDHDLGDGVPTGYDLAKWIEEMAHKGKTYVVCQEWHVHSANPPGGKNIRAAMKSACKAARYVQRRWDEA